MDADKDLSDPSKNKRPVEASRQNSRRRTRAKSAGNSISGKRPNNGSTETPVVNEQRSVRDVERMMTAEQMKDQMSNYSDTHFARVREERFGSRRRELIEKQREDLLIDQKPITEFYKTKELRKVYDQAWKYHSTQRPSDQDDDLPGNAPTNKQKMDKYRESSISDPSNIEASMDQEQQTAIDQYKKQLSIPINTHARIRHLPEPTNTNACIFCGNVSGSEHEERFNELQKSRNCDLEDKLITCEDNNCSHKFHLSCITYETPLYQFHALYLSQGYNTGKLQCPAHYCEACFTHGFQLTASQKVDYWIQVESQIRVFHPACIPLHAGLSIKPNCIILPERNVFTGERLQCCVGCGRRAELEDDEEISFAPDYNLVGCETCVHMFHPNCHGTSQPNTPDEQKTQCEDCINETPIRKLDRIVIQKDQTTMFCAAEVVKVRKLPSEKSTRIGYRFLSDDASEKLRWTKFNHMIRIYPLLAPAFYHTMKQIHSEHTCSVENCNIHQRELNLLAEHMEKQFFSDYYIKRPESVFQTDYIVDEGFRATFPGNYLPPVPYEEFPGLATPYKKEEGYMVKTTRRIPPNTRIGEYVGRIISKATLESMQQQASVSKDREAKFYNFQSRVKAKSKIFKCAIDASLHRNKMSLINHSCAANCVVKPEWYSLGDGLQIERLVVWSDKAIEADEQLHIEYRWKGMKEYCFCKKCGGLRKLIFEDREMKDCQCMP